MNKIDDPIALGALQTMELRDGVARITVGDIGESFGQLKAFLTAIGGKWNKKQSGFVFNRDFESHFYEAQKTGIFDRKDANDFYATSKRMAADVVETSEIFRSSQSVMGGFLRYKIEDDPNFVLRVLEPSAGHGALIEAFKEKFEKEFPGKPLHIDCCEIDPVNANVLRDRGFNVIHEGDFLEFNPRDEERYHVILMNPPYSLRGKKDCYIDHVEHAMNACSIGKTEKAIDAEVLAIVPRNLDSSSPTPKRARFLNRLNLCRTEHIKDGLFDDPKAFAQAGANIKTTLLSIEGFYSFEYELPPEQAQHKVDLFGLHCSSGFGMEKCQEVWRRSKDKLESQEAFEQHAPWFFEQALVKETFVDYNNLRPYMQRLILELGFEESLTNAGGPYSKNAPETAFEKKMRETFFSGYEPYVCQNKGVSPGQDVEEAASLIPASTKEDPAPVEIRKTIGAKSPVGQLNLF